MSGAKEISINFNNGDDYNAFVVWLPGNCIT